jgi:hypothetical protein
MPEFSVRLGKNGPIGTYHRLRATIAQLVEHRFCKATVVGSIPTGGFGVIDGKLSGGPGRILGGV